MNPRSLLTEILPKAPAYALSRRGLADPPNPVTLTFSVTSACQSGCRTCRIGERHRLHPEAAERDLTLAEIEAVFRSLGPVYFFNVSGGEPFLREDLPDIVELACRHLHPRVVHIPTNGILSARIPAAVARILSAMAAHDPAVPLTVKPSIDGVGTRHDEVRGVPGNFERLLETIAGLRALAKREPRLHVELGTVISRFNMDQIDEIADFVRGLGVESYRNEIAEQRAELFNRGDPITPDAATYARLIRGFAARIRGDIGAKRPLARMTEALRLVYYDLAVRILDKRRQVIPCLGGISNAHLNHDGELWPCCVLGYDAPLGRLREADLDFQRVWRSEQARRVRGSIARGDCACPLANQAYSNILFHPPSLLRAGITWAGFALGGGRG